jgi:signal transduction histidine kinase
VSAAAPRRARARRWERRTPIAAAIVLGIVGSLLLGWYWAGAADTAARAGVVRARPTEEMRARVAVIAGELRRDLDELLRRESQRPYYHYSNLFRDPRSTSTGLSLSPSPLASGPGEPLVADHFQINARGEVTLPTINDEAPELSDRSRLAEHLAARTQLAAVAPALRQRVLHEGTAVAVAVAPPDEPDARDGAQALALDEAPPVKSPTSKVRKPTAKKATNQIDRLDPEVYAQNAAPEQVYQNIVSQQRKQAAPVPVPAPSQNALRTLDRGRVNIVTAPLAWDTVELGAGPTLVALREVTTPDGTLLQGLTVDRDALERWLEERETEDEVGLVNAGAALASGQGRTAVLGPWSLVATPPAAALAAAAARADALERGFLLRFIAVAVVAALAGAFVVLLMASAERLARERSQFAAAAAHELRTPLAGLQLYGDMLADGLGDPSKSRDYARRLSEEAARLGRVVANVLGFSQLERGNLSLQPTSADLVPALRELVARAEPALDRLGAFVEVIMPAQLPARFDRDAVARIVGNLLDNAEKYARTAEDRTITLAACATTGGVEIAVRDRGPGIDAITSRRLFRPFSRGQSPDRPAGLGLGLALSRSLAEAMGGSLEYRRTAEQTEFLLRLPAAATAATPSST